MNMLKTMEPVNKLYNFVIKSPDNEKILKDLENPNHDQLECPETADFCDPCAEGRNQNPYCECMTGIAKNRVMNLVNYVTIIF